MQIEFVRPSINVPLDTKEVEDVRTLWSKYLDRFGNLWRLQSAWRGTALITMVSSYNDFMICVRLNSVDKDLGAGEENNFWEEVEWVIRSQRYSAG